MTEQQIKDYLKKYSLTTKEKLAEHIAQLKRNTKPNLELISELNYVLVDEENLFFNVFSREKDNHKEQINNTVYLYNISSLSDGNMIRGEKIVGDLECINKPPQKRLTLHIENVINDAQQEKKSAMFLDEVLAEKENKGCSWTKCGQKDCVCCYPNSAEKQINTKGHSTRLKANNPLVVSEKGKELVFDKDCNLIGKKESNGKVDYSEIDWDIIDLMAKRFNNNKHKYPPGNMLKPIEEKELLFAAYRHLRKMIQPIENDEETFEEHLTAVLCNMQMLYQQRKLNIS
jgi:hypothetical protein